MTNASGAYSVDVPAGLYHAELTPAEDSGFAAAGYTLAATPDDFTPPYSTMLLCETLDDDQARVALQWGTVPSDLDFHMSAPCPDETWAECQGNPTFHLHYGNRHSHPFGEFFEQDLDDVTSYGPETMSIYTGTLTTSAPYRFAVHDYSNLGSHTSYAMSVSEGLQVTVLLPDGNHVFRPAGQTPGTVWRMLDLEFDGAFWTVVEVDDWCFSSSPTRVFDDCP